MSKVEAAVQWAIDIANDNSHGYSQKTRWGSPDYDCSSLVISAFEQAGIPVKTSGATYTGNMRRVFTGCGFEIVTDGTIRRGDVLLNEIHHTALYIGNNQMVEARISELGTVWGEPGDQTGREICISTYRDYPWDYVLRYTPDPVAEPEEYVSSALYDEENLEEASEGYGRDGTILVGTTLPAPKRGDRGDLVGALQHLLLYRGYSLPRWGADNDYGSETESAVQRALDGQSDQSIWEVLIFG